MCTYRSRALSLKTRRPVYPIDAAAGPRCGRERLVSKVFIIRDLLWTPCPPGLASSPPYPTSTDLPSDRSAFPTQPPFPCSVTYLGLLDFVSSLEVLKSFVVGSASSSDLGLLDRQTLPSHSFTQSRTSGTFYAEAN